MGFERRSELWTYDIYPKVVTAGKDTVIHIRAQGGRKFFSDNAEYCAVITLLSGSGVRTSPASAVCIEKDVTFVSGEILISVTLPKEGEYRIAFENEDKKTLVFAVYAVDNDLVGVYPFMGDLHLHTTLSDGSQEPELVAAMYRAHGYDFLAITDHKRYYPSLRVRESFKDIPTGLNLVPGEEVHLPAINGFTVDPHTINFGGEYSINALVEGDAVAETGTDKKYRSIRDDCPDVMTQAQFTEKMTSLTSKIKVPDDVDPLTAATLKWIYDEIRKAGGLAIFPHPTWITGNSFHDSDALNDWLVNNKIFDAFEVLGGENYFEQNGFQTVRYYEDMARGHKYPVVGSTDSHNCTPENRNAYICSTIVFAPENERRAIIDSVKAMRSVAVDTISREFRLVGEMRYVRYACFLIKNYFPLHDDACFEEGRLMKLAVYGTEEERSEAKAELATVSGRIGKMTKKYFDV